MSTIVNIWRSMKDAPCKTWRSIGFRGFWRMWLSQRKLDKARQDRFNAFCVSIGARKIKGQWCRKVDGAWTPIPKKGTPP